jgi:hypothetical protein
MSDHNERAKRFESLAFECAAAANVSASPAAKEEYRKIARHYENLIEGEKRLAEARPTLQTYDATPLRLRCPARNIEFDSGIQVNPSTLARIDQIAVRMRCPLCGMIHLMIEKGEAQNDKLE